MRYNIGHYAQALSEALMDTTEETSTARVRSFLILLKRHRMLGKVEAIITKAERLMAKKRGVRRVSIETAAQESGELRKEVLEAFEGKAWVSERVNPELLAGARILIDDETLIDASGTGRLSQMFKNVF